MITRYALFQGTIVSNKLEAFRKAILNEVLPHWKNFPMALNVHVGFEESRDENAPATPLLLAIDYPDLAAMNKALASKERALAVIATEQVMARFFSGKIYHYTTTGYQTRLDENYKLHPIENK